MMGTLSLFLLLPTPLKVLAIVGGGFFWLGAKPMAVDPPVIEEAVPERVEPKPAQKRAEVVKPKVVAATITVESDGSFIWDGSKLTADQCEAKLRNMIAAGQQPEITLKANALTPHQMVQGAMKLCKKAGVKKVQFSANRSE